MKRSFVVVALLVVLAACGSSNGSRASSSSTTGRGTTAGLADYQWKQVLDAAPWGARAGLRVVRDGDDLLVMGGRTPKASSIPGDSELWGDVWRSRDGGRSWNQLVSTGNAFPARAYFQAVTLGGKVYVLGGQNFDFPNSTFFHDVWSSADGKRWEQVTAAAPWEGRAGLMAAVLDGTIFVFGGSRNDDSAVIGPSGPARVYFNDVWKSTDGKNWTQATAAAPWDQRAGGAVVVKDGAIYLLGGEKGFVCTPQPGCTPPYFNDVWRTTDGAKWQRVTASAGWSPRPGHQCEPVDGQIVCFGGFGQPSNPNDMWVSRDGAAWRQLAQKPWNAASSDAVRYDFDSTTITGKGGAVSIVTVGGDRETFDFSDPQNYRKVDDDVWWFTPSGN